MEPERRSDCELEECIVETKEGRYLEARQSHSRQSLCGDQCSGVVSGSPRPGQPGVCSIDHRRTLIAAAVPPRQPLALESSTGRARLWLPGDCGQRCGASTVTSVPRSSQDRADRRHHPHRDLRSDAQRLDWQHSVTHETECTLLRESRQNVARRVSPQVE